MTRNKSHNSSIIALFFWLRFQRQRQNHKKLPELRHFLRDRENSSLSRQRPHHTCTMEGRECDSLQEEGKAAGWAAQCSALVLGQVSSYWAAEVKMKEVWDNRLNWLSAVVPLRAFVSTLLCSSNTIQGSPGKCSYEDALLCKTATRFWTHIWILFCTPQRPTERCCVRCMHSIENVLQYSDTVVVILLLNSYLVVHNELNMKINRSLLSKSLLLFIDVFHTVPTFSFFWYEEE